MAIGLLGSATQSGAGTTTVYTVPAGISHAVVHIDVLSTAVGTSSFCSLSVGGVLLFVGGTSSTAVPYDSGGPHWSMMLSPGNTVTLTLSGQGSIFAAVSGYEVA